MSLGGRLYVYHEEKHLVLFLASFHEVTTASLLTGSVIRLPRSRRLYNLSSSFSLTFAVVVHELRYSLALHRCTVVHFHKFNGLRDVNLMLCTDLCTVRIEYFFFLFSLGANFLLNF